ncbi:phosphotransferase [Candidatus Poribacteria bacterium]|jgi:Ser/Thr protein kinase RdoA (MazF antagonist)|nr:phosphotransferase [Candidatus Poribacteria bacterium]MBT5537024.1 phosphotransferase [Candidatus Poribacteria bacterium]MBT5714175.1 phosphotransferase [Candidatus Poribacteria bacterium]MBT7100229.1 phosphotransferase [Candidatus Poribacteria bacterium]MBT7808125.1 phosphotransferase [Candidatus Poribacteria bacterium]
MEEIVVRVATEALEAHGMPGARIEDARVGAMRYAGMTIWKLRAVTTDGRPYLVSVNYPDERVDIDTKLAPIGSHMLWLDSLARDTDLAVQAPTRNGEGDFVTRVDGTGEHAATACTVVDWIKGGDLPDAGDDLPPPDVAERMGRLLARLHLHAAVWDIPAGFERSRHDMTRIRHSFSRLRPMVEAGQLSPADYDLLMEAGNRIADMASALGESRAVWGITHGDFHNDNCVIHDGDVRPIDFDFCYLGHYMRDVGYCFSLMTIHDDARDTQFRSAFWRGYADTRAVSEPERDALEAYFIEVGVDFWSERPSDDDAPRELSTLAGEACRALLGGRRVLSV